MERVLVTGGAGYLGWSIINTLNTLPTVRDIVVYDNLARKNYNLFTSSLFRDSDKIRFIQGDILDQRTFKGALEGIDSVCHLAAKVDEPFRDVDLQQFEQINNWGSAVIANEISKSSVKRVAYISSIYVYGTSSSYKRVEDAAIPNSFYGMSKLRGEKQFESILNDKNVYVFRVGNVFGVNPVMRFDVLMNKLVFDAVHRKFINIHGEGNQRRPFIEVNKVGGEIVRMLANEKVPGIYNIADNHYSILDIVNELRQLVPDLEYRFVNRNVQMEDILVDTHVHNDISNQTYSLLEDLRSIKSFIT